MYTITKSFEFSAAHQLSHLAVKQPKHPCARLHGHNYIVTVFLQAAFVEPGEFVRDFGDLDVIKQDIDQRLDHRNLNDVWSAGSRATTSEALAERLFTDWKKLIPQLVAVRVSETPKTYAEYRHMPSSPL